MLNDRSGLLSAAQGPVNSRWRGSRDGRNAAYLAGLGFAVDAIDISDVAIAGLRAAINYLQRLAVRKGTLEPMDWSVGCYEHIAVALEPAAAVIDAAASVAGEQVGSLAND
jgi:hypothetical protein